MVTSTAPSAILSRVNSGGPLSSSLGYGAFGLAIITTAAAAVAIFGGLALSESAAQAWGVVLTINTLVIAGLCATVIIRIARLARARAQDPSAMRLHLRFAGFLSLAAILPALIMAALLGAIFLRLFDTWFSDRVGGVVENAATVARDYVEDRALQVRERVELMAIDLNNPDAAAALPSDRVTYAEYLRVQSRLRGFEAAYVVDRAGVVLAFAQPDERGRYLVPSADDFSAADEDRFPVRYGGRLDPRIRALMRLDAYENAYLYVIQRIPESVVTKLTAAEEALLDYRDARADHGRLRGFIGVIYAQMALLIVAGAASLGLTGASRIVAPIGRLARAAARVGGGDLSARVHLGDRRDEIAILARTFNEMTDQLATQRDELVAARETAEARRELTEAVLAGVSAGVLGVDSEDRLMLANASAVALLAMDDAADLTHRPIADAAPELAALCATAKQTGAPAEEHIQIDRGGQVRHLSARATLAGDGSGAVVITFDDITRLVSAQRSAAWRDVARRIAHEIKNPLTPIQLSAERLQRKYRPEDADTAEVFDRCTETILNKVGDIGRMIDEFSTFARMPSPKVAPVALAPLVRDAVFAQRVATPAIAFDVEILGKPPVAACDERLVSQALANVLKNAAESVAARQTEASGGRNDTGAVHVRVDATASMAIVEVRDNGLGWPTAALDRLVEPYFTTREKGTGLGLAIVKRVMEDHGGGLELANRLDGTTGAVVRLILPLQALDERTGTRMAHAAEAVD